MALTKVSTDGVKDQNVDLTKLPHGDANNDGKFLRANNGGDPTYETVTTTPPDGSITNAKIADDAIDSAKIADDAITSAQMAANSVNTSELIDDAVNSAKIADAAISNNHVNNSAAIQGSKIVPQFGSQNMESTGYQVLNGELRPYFTGAQTQCVRNTHNVQHYWKVAEITGGGGEGGQIVFFGTTDYTGNGHNKQAARTTLVIRCLTNNQLGGIYWTESGEYSATNDIRWKYTGSNNVYEIWIKKGAYDNVVPHITGSFDYAQTFGSTTNSSSAPSGSTAFENVFKIKMKDGAEPAININNEGIITYPSRPCFHGGNIAHDSSGIVEYDVVHINRGNHYRTSDDRFICPVDGIYFVGLFGMSNSSVGTMDIAVQKNGVDYHGCVPYSSGFTGHYHHVSGQGLISCSENDYLQVNIGSGAFYGAANGRHSGFTVFLVA